MLLLAADEQTFFAADGPGDLWVVNWTHGEFVRFASMLGAQRGVGGTVRTHQKDDLSRKQGDQVYLHRYGSAMFDSRSACVAPSRVD